MVSCHFVDTSFWDSHAIADLIVFSVADFLQDSDFHPFKNGFARLSEHPIETWFGFLRSQSPTAQLTARAYWQAAGRQLLKASRDLNKQKAVSYAADPALSDEELLVLDVLELCCPMCVWWDGV